LEDPANRLPKAVVRTAPLALFISTLVVVWFHQTGHQLLRFPFRPWYTKKEEPSPADMLTTLRRVSYEEKSPQPLPKQSDLKTWIAQLTELLSRTGSVTLRPKIRPPAPLHDRFAGGNFTRRAAREPPQNLRNLNLSMSHASRTKGLPVAGEGELMNELMRHS